jgi:transcriptional regulator with XRE-family HTH domain
MTLLATFAQNIRQIRTRKNVSQRAVAEKAKVSVSYISMLERGQRSPPLETLEAIAKALGVPPPSLLQSGRANTRK